MKGRHPDGEDAVPTSGPAPARTAKPGTGAFARELLAQEQGENAKLLEVTIDALEGRAASAERRATLLTWALVVVVALALGRELGLKIPGVGEITTGTTPAAGAP